MHRITCLPEIKKYFSAGFRAADNILPVKEAGNKTGKLRNYIPLLLNANLMNR